MRFDRLVPGVFAVLLPACGSDGVTPPSPPPTAPPAPVVTTLAQGGIELPPNFFMHRAMVSVVPGTITATVDWREPTSPMWMYISDGVCTPEQFANTCPGARCECTLALFSEQTAPKPRVLTLPNTQPATRTLLVWNRSNVNETVTFTVTLSTPAVAGAPPHALGTIEMGPRLGGR